MKSILTGCEWEVVEAVGGDIEENSTHISVNGFIRYEGVNYEVSLEFDHCGNASNKWCGVDYTVLVVGDEVNPLDLPLKVGYEIFRQIGFFEFNYTQMSNEKMLYHIS